MSAPSLKLCQQLKLFHSLEATLAQQVELNSQLGPKNLESRVFLDCQVFPFRRRIPMLASSFFATRIVSILISEASLAKQRLNS